MTKANTQPSKENETREPICLEIWCRVRAYKMKNSMFESLILLLQIGKILQTVKIFLTFLTFFLLLQALVYLKPS